MAKDIYTESSDVDPDTLRNLGPLGPLAGVGEGRGVDRHPVAGGSEDEPYIELHKVGQPRPNPAAR